MESENIPEPEEGVETFSEEPEAETQETMETISPADKRSAVIDIVYDQSFLEEEDGTYVYRLTDQDLIDQYDKLYADAFAEVISEYDETMEMMNQSFDSGQAGERGVQYLGSTFIMDYNFDLDNVGYTYVDLNSDGIYELIFGVLKDAYSDGNSWDYFERAYTLIDGKCVKICEGGVRALHWLGSDGTIYETGSGGAAYGGIWRYHFDPSYINAEEGFDWGSRGFVTDEFVGYWENPVHIVDTFYDYYDMIDPMAELASNPENQITYEEEEALMMEWETRRIRIEWLKFSNISYEQ